MDNKDNISKGKGLQVSVGDGSGVGHGIWYNITDIERCMGFKISYSEYVSMHELKIRSKLEYIITELKIEHIHN